MNDTAPELIETGAGGVTTLTLNRPDRLNPLSESMIAALQDALDRIAADPGVRAVVLTGSGRAFCAGHDLKEMYAHRDQAFQEALFERCSRMMLSIVALPQPVVARVNGLATAAGCQLLATCDLAVASSEARIAVNGIDHGLFCSAPSVPLSRNVPRKQAFEMLFTGEFIDAETARRRGLVNRVAPPESSTRPSPGSAMRSVRSRPPPWRPERGCSTARSSAISTTRSTTRAASWPAT